MNEVPKKAAQEISITFFTSKLHHLFVFFFWKWNSICNYPE